MRGIVWCPHCGQPHELLTRICPQTKQPMRYRINRTAAEKAQKNHPLVGHTVGGKYKISKLIGRGGMGEVFEAENVVLRRSVAMKVVRGSDAMTGPERSARLRREAMLVAAVKHPNICDVYDVGEMPDGTPFIVLELLQGETLSKRLSRPTRSTAAEIVDVFAQLLSALQAAHGVHIVHRDLKPSNVFLVDRIGWSPLVKLLDFGMGKDLTGHRMEAITRPGRAVGTPEYMAPEQLRQERADHRVDLWAVGLMIYKALTGVHPFSGQTQIEFTVNILRGAPAPIRALRPDLPQGVSDLVMRALEKEADRRFATALEMQSALARAFAFR